MRVGGAAEVRRGRSAPARSSVLPRPVRLAAGLALAGLLVAGCGADRTGGPTGAPEDVVRAAPDLTLAEGTAGLSVISQDAFLDGTVDLASGRARARLRSQGVAARDGLLVELDYRAAYLGRVAATDDPAATRAAPSQLLGGGVQPGNPLAVLDLLRGAVQVESYGGAAVRGASTFRYDLLVNPDRVLAQAPEDRRAALGRFLEGSVQLPLAVWIDAAGRVRRAQMGNDLSQATTTTDRRGLPFATTVDFFDFGGPGEAAG